MTAVETAGQIRLAVAHLRHQCPCRTTARNRADAHPAQRHELVEARAACAFAVQVAIAHTTLGVEALFERRIWELEHPPLCTRLVRDPVDARRSLGHCGAPAIGAREGNAWCSRHANGNGGPAHESHD